MALAKQDVVSVENRLLDVHIKGVRDGHRAIFLEGVVNVHEFSIFFQQVRFLKT